MALQEKENGIQIFFLRQNVPILAKHTNSILKECMISQHICAQLLSCVRLFATPCPVARQAPLSMEFSRQESWRGLPFSSPRDLPDPGIEPESPALVGRFFTTEPPGFPKEFHAGQHLHILLFHLYFHKICLLSKMPAGL